jgi:hypothetical protein
VESLPFCNDAEAEWQDETFVDVDECQYFWRNDNTEAAKVIHTATVRVFDARGPPRAST